MDILIFESHKNCEEIIVRGNLGVYIQVKDNPNKLKPGDKIYCQSQDKIQGYFEVKTKTSPVLPNGRKLCRIYINDFIVFKDPPETGEQLGPYDTIKRQARTIKITGSIEDGILPYIYYDDYVECSYDHTDGKANSNAARWSSNGDGPFCMYCLLPFSELTMKNGLLVVEK